MGEQLVWNSECTREFRNKQCASLENIMNRNDNWHLLLSWFWVDMAMGEKVQAGLLHHCCKNGLFADTLPNEDQLAELRTLFDELESVVGQGGLSVDDAFAVAERLERSPINNVCASLTAPIDVSDHPARKNLNLSTEGR